MFRQMNLRLRETFGPVFLLFELKTIVLCLRNKAVERAVEIDALLERSLLADTVKQVLHKGTDVPSTIAALAATVAVATEDFRELGTAYAEDGLKGFEDSLMRVFLEYAAGQPQNRVIKAFFAAFIDLRNTMILYKHLRWKVEDGPPFISGGTTDTARLRKLLEREGESDLDHLVGSVTGIDTIPVPAGEAALETVLLRRMTTRLRKIGRESEDVGVIMDYVWRSYAQARNLAVVHHGKDIETDTLEKELIL